MNDDNLPLFLILIWSIILICLSLFLVGVNSGNEAYCVNLAESLNTEYIVNKGECFLKVNEVFVNVVDLIKVGR